MSRRCDDVLGPCDDGCDLCTPHRAERAIRDAVVTLEAIETRLANMAQAKRDPSLDLWAAALRDTVRYLLSALDGSDTDQTGSNDHDT